MNFLLTIVRRCDEKKADILGFGVTATSLSNPKHVAHDALACLRDVLYYYPRSLHIAIVFFLNNRVIISQFEFPLHDCPTVRRKESM